MSERSLLTADWLISNDVQAFAILHCWLNDAAIDLSVGFDYTVTVRAFRWKHDCNANETQEMAILD